MSEEKVSIKQIRIERKYPEDLKSYYVSNIVVQHEPEMFFLSFFEVFPPPIIADTDEERAKALGALTQVDAKCVARLAITPGKMKEFITAMQENYKGYQKLIAAMKGED